MLSIDMCCQILRCFMQRISTFYVISPLAWMFSHWHRVNFHSLLGTRLGDVVLIVLDKPGISCSDNPAPSSGWSWRETRTPGQPGTAALTCLAANDSAVSPTASSYSPGIGTSPP